MSSIAHKNGLRPFLVVVAGLCLVWPSRVQAIPQRQAQEDEHDYWAGIEFGPSDLAEVRRFVRLFYIDSHYDKHLAWIMAADAALHALRPRMELLPKEFYEKLRKRRGFRKRLSGKVYRLAPTDLFLIHEVGERAEEAEQGGDPFSDWRKAREREKRWRQDVEKAFKVVPFSRADFRRVMEFAIQKAKGEQVRKSMLYIAATKGYLAALDPHSTIIAAKAWEENTRETRDASFEGIGTVLTKSGRYVVVETPIEGQPAYKAGLRAGDIIVAVDGKNVVGWSLSKVVKIIRGPKGTKVTLTVRRQGEPRQLDITIVRQRIEMKNVQWRFIKGHPDLGYLKIRGFVEGTSVHVRQAIERMVQTSEGGRLRGLVVDLRNNPGGLLQEAVETADLFLDKGMIVSVKNPGGRDEIYKASGGAYEFPVVVLVNASTASAAEILASALQENSRAIVVGRRTFGKASVQTLLNPLMRRDYYIKLTVARYYAPSGRTLQLIGVPPNVVVPEEPDKPERPAFREEDLLHPLSSQASLEDLRPSPEAVGGLGRCVSKMGLADRLYGTTPKPRAKPDYQLMKATDFLECSYLERARLAFQHH